jgi:hypothetical protein
MLTKQDLDEYTKPEPKGEGFDDNDTSGKYICYNCVFMNTSHSEMEWCENDSCRNHDKFVERKYKKDT